MVIIKDMEMPKKCSECSMCKQSGIDLYCGADYVGIDNAFKKRDNCPLVEIVTCKDCKYYRNEDDDEWCTNHSIHDNKFWVREDYYCADAERRE